MTSSQERAAGQAELMGREGQDLLPSSSPEEPRKRLWLFFRIILSFGLLALLLAGIDLEKMAQLFVGLRWDFFCLVIAMLLLERVLNAWKWQVLLQSSGTSLGLWPLFRIIMSSSCFGLFLPSALGMDVLRMIAVSRCSQRPIQVVATTAVDRGLSVFINLFMAAVTSLLAAGRFIPWPLAMIFPALFFGVSATGFAMTMPRLSKTLSPIIDRVLGKSLSGKLRQFYCCLMDFRNHAPAMVQNMLIFLGILVLRVTIVFTCALTLNIEVDFLLLTMMLPLIWVALMLPISIGGLGLQEGAFFLFLGFIGVSGSAAVAMSLLEHVVVRIANLPGLYFYLRGGLVGGKVENCTDD